MRVLIVESNPGLGTLWQSHIERLGCTVDLVHTQAEAIAILRREAISVIVLNLILKQGSAFAVADYASYKSPEAQVIFVTNTSFFSDGSIFKLVPNTCAYVPLDTPPEDLAAIAQYYASR